MLNPLVVDGGSLTEIALEIVSVAGKNLKSSCRSLASAPGALVKANGSTAKEQSTQSRIAMATFRA